MKKQATILLFAGLVFLMAAVVPAFSQTENLEWARRLGGTEQDIGWSIAVDAKGHVYTTGNFQGTMDADPGNGTFNLVAAAQGDAFISKLDADGNFVWAKRLGGAGLDISRSIALDAAGNVYVTGAFEQTIDLGTFSLTSAGDWDVFIAKLDANGNFVWAKRFGGAVMDDGNSIAVDAAGNVHVTGIFRGTIDFDPGSDTFHLTSTGTTNAFLSKLDTDGNFIWAKRFGGTSGVIGYAIAIDAAGNVHTTGRLAGTADFDPGSGTHNLISAGNHDVYVSKLDADGNFVWAKRMGGANTEWSFSIAVDALGNVFTTGYFYGTADFDPGNGEFYLDPVDGAPDVFISKLDADGNFEWAKQIDAHGGNSVATDAAGNVYIAGAFSGTCDFDTGSGIPNLVSAGESDVLISKLDTDGNFLWAKRMGGNLGDNGYAVAVDVADNVYTTGRFQDTTEFGLGNIPFSLVSAGGFDVFVHKFCQGPPKSADFTLNQQGAVVTFANSAVGATSFYWDFGDGNASTEKNPVHSYAADGAYSVRLTVQNMCGARILDKEITIKTVAAQEPARRSSFRLFPNPNNGHFNIEIGDLAAGGEVEFLLFGLDGRLLRRETAAPANDGTLVRRFDCSDLPTGIYLLRVRTGAGAVAMKVTVQR